MSLRAAAVAFFCLFASTLAAAETIIGRIVGVTDGATFTLLDANKMHHRIRIADIDAPEKAQPFGKWSKQLLVDLAHGWDAAADCPKIDRYARQVCVVTVDGRDVGLEQIARGMAWHFKRYERERAPQDRAAYI